jgi:septum formation protein
MERKLILASKSPRRKRLLKEAGFIFEIVPSPFEEEIDQEQDPHVLAVELSREKAAPVAIANAESIVISADTLVVLDGHIMGKPRDAKEAKAMLGKLSGNGHEVITGFTIRCESLKKETSMAVTTKVFFRELSDEEISEYVATGEPMDKAGAYGIQGKGGELVEHVEGDILNVVGLPLKEVRETLKDFNIHPS